MEKINSIEPDLKNFKVSLMDHIYDAEAFLSHYLYNLNNIISDYYKRDTVHYTDNFTEYGNKDKIYVLKNRIFQELLSHAESAPFANPEKNIFKFIDLFAGIGGFRIAMQNTGGRCIYTSEWNKDAQKTYRENFGQVPFGDITADRIKNYIPAGFDILCAGFPCQAFSIAGHQKGFSDIRGTLFFDIQKIVEKHRPKVVFLENVKNLIFHDNGNTFKIIIETLEKKLGYKVFYQVLNSMTHANIPQNRERIFIAAFDPLQVKNYKQFKFPQQTPLTKTIYDFLETAKQEDHFYYTDNQKLYNELKKNITKKDTVYQWRRTYVRENKNNVCPTLTANMGTGGHNVPLVKDDFGIRKLTPKECFALQGFPMNQFILPKTCNSKLYMQAGNSVSVTLVEKIGCEIMKVLQL